jgi:murein DD-endopeptidase MepM/ murein hydrolase activator NlpD
MIRNPSIIAALVALLSSASAAQAGPDRVAMVQAEPGSVPMVVEPRALLASYDTARAEVAELASWLAPDVAWSAWGNVTDALAGSAHGALDDLLAGGRNWLSRTLVPSLPSPPDLTALTTIPVSNHTTSGYGWRDDPIRHRAQFHAGADIKSAKGTSVYAAGAGVVIIAGQQHGYGNVIYLDHGNGIITRYGHLSKILVKKGETVDPTMEIGRVGATGRATGPHLHFEVRIDGRPVNPVLALRVAELERTDVDLAKLVGLALAPDVQSHWINDEDPPRTGKAKHPKGQRPERRHRAPRDRNQS